MSEQGQYRDQSGVALREATDCEGVERIREHSVIEALTQLALRKRLIARVTSVGILIGVILCFALPDRYTAVTMIMPPKQTQSTTSFLNAQLGSLADAAGGAGGLLKDPNSIYMGLLRSRPVADAIIGRFNLAEVYRAKDMTAARKTLKDRTEIVSEKSTLISITVIDGDKRRAADLANAYAEELRVLSKTISFTEASQRRKFFEEQVKTQKEVLIAAELAFQQVQQSKGLIQLDAQAGVIIGSLAKLRGEIAAKEVQLQALLSYSTEHNSDVQLVERELSAMRSEAARLEQHSQPTSYSDMSLKDVPKAGLDYIRAARELHYQQAFFDTLLRQYEAASLDEAKEAAVIQVVEPAIAPEHRSSPKRATIIPLAIFAGIFGGCLLARFVWWKQSVQSDPDRAMRLRSLTSALLTRQGSGA